MCVKLNQILSHAYKRLSTARALRQSTTELVKAVTELDQEVTTFKQSVEHLVSLDEPLDEQRILPTMPVFQLLMIHFCTTDCCSRFMAISCYPGSTVR